MQTKKNGKLFGPALSNAARALATKYPDADGETLANMLDDVHPKNTWEAAKVSQWTGRPVVSNGRLRLDPPHAATPDAPATTTATEGTLPELFAALVSIVGTERAKTLVIQMIDDLNAAHV